MTDLFSFLTKPRKHTYRQLTVKENSIVDRGANGRAKIVMWKTNRGRTTREYMAAEEAAEKMTRARHAFSRSMSDLMESPMRTEDRIRLMKTSVDEFGEIVKAIAPHLAIPGRDEAEGMLKRLEDSIESRDVQRIEKALNAVNPQTTLVVKEEGPMFGLFKKDKQDEASPRERLEAFTKNLQEDDTTRELFQLIDEVHKAEMEELKKSLAPAPATEDEPEAEPAPVAKAELPIEVTKALEEAAVTKRLLEQEIEKRETAEFLSIAKNFEAIGFDVQKFAPALRRVRKADVDAFDMLIESLDGVKARVEKAESILTAEKGMPGSDDPEDARISTLDAKVAKVMETEKVTYAVALRKVMETDDEAREFYKEQVQ